MNIGNCKCSGTAETDKGVFQTLQSKDDVLREVKRIIGDKGTIARDAFDEMDNTERIAYIGYQLYRNGYYDGLNCGLEVGIIERNKEHHYMSMNI